MWTTCIAIGTSIVLMAIVMLLVFAVMQKRQRTKIKNKEELALKGVTAGIKARLHAAYPTLETQWRWVCRPAGFAINGGIARIEVIDKFKNVSFVDVCLSINGYMALHVSNVVELTALEVDIDENDDLSIIPEDYDTPENTEEISPVSSVPPKTGSKPCDEASVITWYNIMLIDTLTTLIDELNAKGEVCVYIGRDGKAYIEENDSISVVYEFGAMPDVALWNHITDKLGEEGLFVEIQEGNRIFISWA